MTKSVKQSEFKNVPRGTFLLDEIFSLQEHKIINCSTWNNLLYDMKSNDRKVSDTKETIYYSSRRSSGQDPAHYNTI